MTEAEPRLVLSAAGLLGALRLASAALPIGTFAYSQALEEAVHRGLVVDSNSAKRWIVGLLSVSVLSNDVPMLVKLRAAWDANDGLEVARLGHFLFATRATKELREEERQLGSALFRLLGRLGVEAAGDRAADPRATLASAYALAAARWNIPNAVVAMSFCFAWAEGQVGAATRLIPLGQSDAQRVLSAAIGTIEAGIYEALELDFDEMSCTVPGQAWLSAAHETQYSRLFRS